jgi:hypothetical protein
MHAQVTTVEASPARLEPSHTTKERLYWHSGCCVSAELTMRRSDRPLWGSDPPSISLVHPSRWKGVLRSSDAPSGSWGFFTKVV